MMSYRSLYIVAIAAAALAADAGTVRADGPGCTGPNCGGAQGSNGKYCAVLPYPTNYSLFGHSHGPLPTYQAAPWYLYWPYDGHFLTPAPITGAFYGPPSPGNFPVNPYFPGPSYGYGYGPMSGGPVPSPALMAPPGGMYQYAPQPGMAPPAGAMPPK